MAEKAKRVFVTDEAFVRACQVAGATIESIAAATGMQKSSVQQRRVRLRNAGVALDTLQRGGGRKATAKDVAKLNAVVAEATGKPVEEVAKIGEQLVAAHAKREAETTEVAETPAK